MGYSNNNYPHLQVLVIQLNPGGGSNYWGFHLIGTPNFTSNELRLPRGNFLDFNVAVSVILMQVFCALVRRLFDIVSVVI